MAEALLNKHCGNYFEAKSAGLEPGTLNPLAVAAMEEIGIDISRNQPQSVFDVFKSGQLFTYAITVCDETSAERCPVVPGVTRRLHWGFPDPSGFTGTWEERFQKTREVRNLIEERIKEWCASVCEKSAGVE